MMIYSLQTDLEGTSYHRLYGWLHDVLTAEHCVNAGVPCLINAYCHSAPVNYVYLLLLTASLLV